MARPRIRKKPLSQINVVPYIDVMLVMLVVFMITAPMLTEGVRVNLPNSTIADPVENHETEPPLIVTVDQAGRYFFMGRSEELYSSNELIPKVTAILRRNPTIQVLVKGDRAVNYAAIIDLISLLRQAGAPTVGLITESN